jgi:hypothetical protein
VAAHNWFKKFHGRELQINLPASEPNPLSAQSIKRWDLAPINFVRCERKITPSIARHGACRAVNEKETERVISWWLTIG